jgi:hypothetical protein
MPQAHLGARSVRAVGAPAGIGVHGGARADVDHDALAGPQGRQRGTDQLRRRDHVGVQECVPRVGVGARVGQPGERLQHACIVHQRVHAPKGGGGGEHQPVRHGAVGEVAHHDGQRGGGTRRVGKGGGVGVGADERHNTRAAVQ